MTQLEIHNSASFIADHCKLNSASILDVGCGNGQLSLELTNRGADVSAIEINPELAKKARLKGKGIAVFNLDFLKFKTCEKYDVIIFSRSLHHIYQLETAVEKASSLMGKNGLLILEEFDFTHVNEPTLKWYYEFMDEKPNDVVSTWEQEHVCTPPLNTGLQMYLALRRKFKIVHFERCPYLFRSLSSSNIHPEQILAIETELINKGEILPVGMRVVASKI